MAHVVALADGAFLTALCPGIKSQQKSKLKQGGQDNSDELDDEIEFNGEEDDEVLQAAYQVFLETTQLAQDRKLIGALLLKIRTFIAKVWSPVFPV